MNIRFTSLALLTALTAGCAGTNTNAPSAKEAASQQATKSVAATTNRAPFAVTVAKPRKTFPVLRQMMAQREGFASIVQLMDLFAADEHADLERPVVFVTTGEDHAFGFSLAVVPGQEKAARAQLEKLGIAVVPGNKSEKFVCDIVRGGDGPRKVCTGNEPTFATLGAAAAVVPTNMTSDFRFEMDAATALKMQKARKQAKDSAAAGKDMSDVIVEKAFADLGRFTADVSYDGGFDVRLAMQVKGDDPMWRTLFEAPAKAPPSTFGLLPEDSEIAVFANAPPSSATKELKAMAQAAILSGCSESDLPVAREAFDSILFTGGSVSLAIGYDRAKAESAAKSLVGKGGSNTENVERARKALGAWALFGFEEPTERWTTAMRKLEALDCSPKEKKKKSSTKTRITAPAKALGLPAGTTEFVESHTPDSPKDKAKPPTYVFVVPDGARTWIAVGDDEAAVASRIRSSIDPKARHLGERVGAEMLRAPATGAAVFSAEALSWAGNDIDTTPSLLHSAELLAAAASMPTGGRTPIPVSFVSAPDRKGGELRVHSRIDSAAVTDLMSVFASDDEGEDADD